MAAVCVCVCVCFKISGLTIGNMTALKGHVSYDCLKVSCLKERSADFFRATFNYTCTYAIFLLVFNKRCCGHQYSLKPPHQG